jgi:hypothetical protein
MNWREPYCLIMKKNKNEKTLKKEIQKKIKKSSSQFMSKEEQLKIFANILVDIYFDNFSKQAHEEK